MSQKHVKYKAQDALKVTGGNRREASLLLQAWCEADPELKKALFAPFISNVCALAIQRAAISTEKQIPSAIKRKNNNDLMSAIGSRQTISMSSNRLPQSPPPRSSARHRQAMATLAASFKNTDG